MGGPSYCGRECFVTAWKAGHSVTCARLKLPFRGIKYEFHAASSHELPAGIRLVQDHDFQIYMCEEGDDGCPALDIAMMTAAETDAAATPVAPEELRELQQRQETGEWLLVAAKELPAGSYKLPSEFFVQVVSRLAFHKSLDRFAIGPIGVWDALAMGVFVGDEFLDPGCLTPIAPASARLAFARPAQITDHIRVWVYGPDKKNRWLGMGLKGPCRLTIDEWIAESCKGILQDAADQPTTSMDGVAEMLGNKKHWRLLRKPPMPAPK